MIDLLSIQPHKVSRDLSGYITYIYGEGKTGKTTLATHAPGSLLLAFERGYNALPGVMAQDVTSWGDVKAIVRELKKPEVKAKFTTVIFDTVDIAGDLCERYVCAQHGVDVIKDISFGQGWNYMKKEFENTVRSITQLGYAVFFISHDKDKEFTRKDGTKYNQTVPTCANSFNLIAKNAADIYAFAEKYQDDEGNAKVRLILRSPDNSVDTGSRFKYIEPMIDMDYDALVNALNTAIEREAEATNGAFVTDERNAEPIAQVLDFDALMTEFGNMANALTSANEEFYKPRIILIIERYLGRGKKMSDATMSQVELINQIVEEIKSDLYIPFTKKNA